MNSQRANIVIVGGGAAGLTAAIFAAQNAPDASVVILDSAKQLGAKILVAGGGRCNVTHHAVTPRDYHGPTNAIKRVLAALPVDQTIEWFASMGVNLKREPTGKLFPVTDSARTVLDGLLRRCAALGVDIQTHRRVQKITRADNTYTIEHSSGVIETARLVLAAGGRSLPKSGSDGSGWSLARALGHSVTQTHPALVPLVLDGTFFHAALSGVSHDVTLAVHVDGKRQATCSGSMLWTHFGVSGPVVLDISRVWTTARAAGQSPTLHAALLPDEPFDAVDRWLLDLAEQSPKRTVVRALTQRGLPQRVAQVLADHIGLTEGQTTRSMTRDQRRTLTHALTDLTLPVTKDRGWNYAEVTAGGVPLSEIDTRTMESRIAPGLHIIGEMLDVDGRIGGFNFQWAWASGKVAGRGMCDL